MAEFGKMILDEYGIVCKPITTRNPQSNAIIERVHQTLSNMIRSFQLHKTILDKDDTWSGMLSACMYAIRATVHITLQATPTQLVFGRDANLNIQFEANWNFIRKQAIKK